MLGGGYNKFNFKIIGYLKCFDELECLRIRNFKQIIFTGKLTGTHIDKNN